ncbi:MAG: sulfatase-like hydrolase/transferase [Candidatus ainarchaeum sp.]|nr:sulfatase-like hydrolase/transferase [Candidatus ainarchaeum sp.]
MSFFLKWSWKKVFFFVILISIICLLAVKLTCSSRPMYILATWLFDSGIYALLFFIYIGIDKLSTILSKIVFIFLYLFHTVTAYLTSYFMDDMFGRGLSFLSIDSGNASFSFTFLFPWHYLIFFIICLVLAVVISYLLSNFIKIHLPKKAVLPLLFLALLLLVGTPIIFVSNVDNFYVNTIYALAETKETITLTDFNCDTNLSFLKQNNYPALIQESKYKKIVVFVMESLVYGEFYKDISKVSEDQNFFGITKGNSNYYFNYYTNNQDSVPSMVTILSSQFIPTEAYTYSEEYSLCGHPMMEEYNLVDHFNDENYYTSFYVSNTAAPCELAKYKWSKINDIKENYDSLTKEFMCFNPYPYDIGCEDIVLLDRLLEDLKKEKVFIMQEFIYGHSNLYIKESGLSKTEYYSKYLAEFYKKIKAEGLDKDLLIAIVSDHGLREKVDYSKTAGYNIPLIFVANDLTYREDNNLLSHLDFKTVLFSYLYGLDYYPEEQLFFVGPTASKTFGFKTAFENGIFEEKDVGEYNILSSTTKDNNYLQEQLVCYQTSKTEFNDK